MISVEDVQQRALLDIHCVAVVPIKLKGPFYSITKNHMLVIKSALVSGFRHWFLPQHLSVTAGLCLLFLVVLLIVFIVSRIRTKR